MERSKGWAAVGTYLQMIKIEHSIFALPFAFIGMVWASLERFDSAWPGWRIFCWIVVAMVSARSAAMAFNRIADREFDARNPRTQSRAIPAGLLTLRQSSVFFYVSVAVFLLAAGMLNALALALAPVALLITLGYSYTKRFTALCHYVLGLSLGIAPAAAWIAVTGSLDTRILWVVAAVALWVAGFDILYSLQDIEFDREQGLHSLPAAVGDRSALVFSRLSHLMAVGCLVVAAWVFGGWISLAGALLAGTLLAYEQSLVRPGDLSRLDAAFFTLNGYVSIGMFVAVWLDSVFLT